MSNVHMNKKLELQIKMHILGANIVYIHKCAYLRKNFELTLVSPSQVFSFVVEHYLFFSGPDSHAVVALVYSCLLTR